MLKIKEEDRVDLEGMMVGEDEEGIDIEDGYSTEENEDGDVEDGIEVSETLFRVSKRVRVGWVIAL